MLPGRLLTSSIRGRSLAPRYLAESDHPWLRYLLDELDRYAGRPQRELDARLREPLLREGPADKVALAIHVPRRACRSGVRAAVPPRTARAAVFARASTGDTHAAVLAEVAAQLRVLPDQLEESLLADLPGERRVAAPEPPLTPVQLALRTNLALAQGLLARASAVTIEVEGNARALVRHAHLRGLICTVASRDGAGGAVLRVSGPFALFRHTLLYGRALGELVPLCSWCPRFSLRATCILGDRQLALEIGPTDPIFPAAEPRRYDSRLEERFARDFGRVARDWDVIREPEPVPAGNSLLFPDFALQHRADPRRRWLLEIMGFWTADYVATKLAAYRAADIPDLILCIDAERNCADADLPAHARIIRFRRRIDAAAVLAIVAPVGGGKE